MRLPLCVVFLLLLGFITDSVTAQGILPGDRWPVQGKPPLICGREIPRFVLFEQLSDRDKDKNRSSRRVSPANLFIPVSQDKIGVFYHAMNGIVERGFRGRHLVPGGLYVHKTKPNTIFIYFGDARKPGWVLRPMLRPLPMEVLEKLRTGHAAGN